jgi:hypothetical protein
MVRPTFSKIALFLSALCVVSCGGTGQDVGSVNSNTTTVSGVGIDGYLANATVCLDTNENDKCDAWEPSTTTDNDGNFSFTTTITANDVVVRITGGYDAQTNEPFSGQITTRVDVVNGQTLSNTVITPLTTLITHAASAEDRQKLLDALDITEADLLVDYLQEDDVDPALLEKAILVHSISKYLGDQLEDRYTELGEEGSSDNATGFVYEALVEKLIENHSAGFISVLTNEALLSSVLEDAESELIENYQEAELTLPTRLTTEGTSASAGESRAVELAKQIAESIDDFFDVTPSDTISLDEASAGVRLVEVLVQKAIQEESTEDGSINDYVMLLQDGAKTDQLLTELAKPNFDLGSLVTNQDFSNIETVKGLATLGASASPLVDLPGKSILVDDPENSQPAELKHARLELYFGGSSGATSGELTACIRYIEGAASQSPNAASDADLEDGDTRGAYVKGTWKKFSNYSTLLSLRITDGSAPYEAIIKSAADKDGKKVFRFDFGDDLADWFSTAGLTTAPANKPDTDAECRTRFNSVESN